MLTRNVVLNLVGNAAPLVAALFLVPPLIAQLQTERFGFLALAWVLVGYLSLLDLGLGRTLTRLVAEEPRLAGTRTLPKLGHAALTLTFMFGTAAGALLFAAAPGLVEHILTVPTSLRLEAEQALRTLALYLPFVTLSAALRGILEGRQRFDWVNAIRVPLGIFTFAAPLIATHWSTTLVAMVVALGVPRLAAALALWFACRRVSPELTRFGWPTASAAREVLGYGGWLTVSNIVGPLMVYIDRFVIGAALAISAVAYFTAPYEVVTRLWLVPAAVTAVLFPAMAAAGPDRLALLYRGGIKLVLTIVFPAALALTVFAAEGLHVWLGERFAAEGARVAQLLCIGTGVNCLAYLPFTLLQARGHADLTGKTHVAELPLYLACLAIGVSQWGLVGAAFVWALRCVADALVLFLLARRVNAGPWGFTVPQVGTIAAAVFALAGAMVPSTLATKAIYFASAVVLFSAIAWLVLLDETERIRVRNPMGLLHRQPRS